MTKKEKNKLAMLVTKILDVTNILSPVLEEALYKRIIESGDKDVLDILISHFDTMKTYEIYNRFDHEASVRDIENLLNIIFSGRKGK